MRQILIDVPYTAQFKDGYCLPTCIKMFLDYYKIELHVNEIIKETKCGKDGIYVEQAASFLSKKLYMPSFIYADYDLHPSWYRGASRKNIYNNIRNKIKQLKKQSRSKKKKEVLERLKHLLLFMENRGVYRFSIPRLKQLEKLIREKRPVIVTVDPYHTFKKSREKGARITSSSHAVIVVGYEKQRIILHDPGGFIRLGGFESSYIAVEKDIFLQGWYKDWGAAIYV